MSESKYQFFFNQNLSCALPYFTKNMTLLPKMKDLLGGKKIHPNFSCVCPEWHPWQALHWGFNFWQQNQSIYLYNATADTEIPLQNVMWVGGCQNGGQYVRPPCRQIQKWPKSQKNMKSKCCRVPEKNIPIDYLFPKKRKKKLKGGHCHKFFF